ncbi:MAG TPA: AraC family transcriptional regulator [Lachnospiraceae bacterium]|nr:AraC family transcriptional regulator [Lachnospiraceae bacterium]
MYEIIDEFCWTKEKKIITKEKHQVPGLCNFSHYTHTHSTPPAPLHYHSNIIEIHCMIKGSLYNQIEKDGLLTQYVTMGNQAFISYPFEIHGNGSLPLPPHEFFAFQINISNPADLLGLNKEYSYSLYKQLIQLPYHQLCLGATHINNLRSAYNFFSELTPEATKIGVQFLTCFLFNLKFLTPISETTVSGIDAPIKKAIDYMTKNISEDLHVSDLASISGYSLSRFKVKFKSEIGVTPAEYINLQKIEAAKKQLTASNCSITDIAYSLGFSSVSYFSSVFKKLTSCTPQHYRKNYSSND